LKTVLLIVLAYFIGSIPFSYLFSRFKGVDPRKSGTGNVGASNALIVAGPWIGALALIGDVAKGFLVIQLARLFGLNDWAIALCAFSAVLGHDFSIFLNFKGGKGVAVTGGVLIALDPIFTVLVVLLWILSMMVLRVFISSTVLILCLLPGLMWLGSWRLEYIIFGLLNALLGIYAHRNDLKRFFAGEELTISESMAKHLKKS